MKVMVLALAAYFFLSDAVVYSCLAQAKEDIRDKQLEAERRKLGTIKYPADRAESLMKIADISLTYVVDAVAANDLPKLASSVEDYKQTVTEAHDTMMKSGLDPYKRPKGYQAVELTTRKHLRILEEAVRRLAVADRKVLENVKGAVSKIHDDMIHALFQ